MTSPAAVNTLDGMSTSLQALKGRDDQAAAVICRAVKAFSAAWGLTLDDLAMGTGITYRTMQRRLAGATKQGFTANETDALARFMNISLEDLYAGRITVGRPPNPPKGWAPGGSNPEPADYKLLGSRADLHLIAA